MFIIFQKIHQAQPKAPDLFITCKFTHLFPKSHRQSLRKMLNSFSGHSHQAQNARQFLESHKKGGAPTHKDFVLLALRYEFIAVRFLACCPFSDARGRLCQILLVLASEMRIGPGIMKISSRRFLFRLAIVLFGVCGNGSLPAIGYPCSMSVCDAALSK